MGSLRRAGRYVLWEAEEVQGTAHRPQMEATHVEIPRRSSQGTMPQEDLDRAGIDSRVESMRGKRVPERMNARPAVQVRPPSRLFIDLAGSIT